MAARDYFDITSRIGSIRFRAYGFVSFASMSIQSRFADLDDYPK